MFKIKLLTFIFFATSCCAGLEIGVGQLPTSNVRKRPEDFYFFSKNWSEDLECFAAGVFDGHGSSGFGMLDGFKVAKYASENMETIICKTATSYESIKLALKIAFRDLEQGIPEPERCGFCGSTALVCFIKDENLYIANTGDSQALIVFKSGEKQTTILHKAIPETFEGERIRQYHGTIHHIYAFDFDGEAYLLNKIIEYAINPPKVSWIDEDTSKIPNEEIIKILEDESERSKAELEHFAEEWFVYIEDENSSKRLAMSRSLGDFEFKTVGVISEPSVYKFPLDAIDYVILATDGLWNGISPDNVAFFISQERNQKSPDQMCRDLADIAQLNDSTDDITAVGLFFNWAQDPD